MSRKLHPVVSNLQILLREDSELGDSNLMGAHRLKVEAAIQVIQTSPTLRGVAMESLSQAILFLFKHKDKYEKSVLSTSLAEACSLLQLLLFHCAEGWASLLLDWSLFLLAQLAKQEPNRTPLEEEVKYWMDQPVVKQLVGFVTTGVKRRLDLGDKEGCVRQVLEAASSAAAPLGWLLAHVISQSPQELTPALLTTASSLSPPVSVATSISQALDLLASSNQAVVMEAILTSCNKALQSGKAAPMATQFLVKLLLQSPRLCSLVAGDVLKLVRAETIHSLVVAEVERSAAEEGEDEGEIVSEHGDQEEERSAGKMEVEQDADSLPSLLARLILRLRGRDAIQAVNVIVKCVSPDSGGAIAEQVEDGEISVEVTAKQLLLEASRLVMNKILAQLEESSLLHLLSLSSISKTHSHQQHSPAEFAISLREGLQEWAGLLGSGNLEESIEDWLRELVSYVGMCSPKLSGCKVLAILLSKCSPDKLSVLLSVHSRLSLRYPAITRSAVMQAVLSARAAPECLARLCKNLCCIVNNHGNCFPIPVTSLLSLLPCSSTEASSELLRLVVLCPSVLSSGGVATRLRSAQLVLGHFYKQLCCFSRQMTEGKLDSWHLEQQLTNCRKILTHLSHSSEPVRTFVCTDIVQMAASVDMDAYLSQAIPEEGKAGPALRSVGGSGTLFVECKQRGVGVSGNFVFNTRLAQHSSTLHRKPPPGITRRNKEVSLEANIAIPHCVNHLIWLAAEVCGDSTVPIATVMMDVVVPHLPVPMTYWPEEDPNVTNGRHTLELLLIAYRKLDQHPVLWGLLSLVSRDSRGMEVCSGLVHLLLSMLISYWQKNKGSLSRDHPTQLHNSEMTVQCLARCGWLPAPLKYVGELFPELWSEEMVTLLSYVWKSVRKRFSEASGDSPNSVVDEKILVSIRSVLQNHITKFGPVYARFVRYSQN